MWRLRFRRCGKTCRRRRTEAERARHSLRRRGLGRDRLSGRKDIPTPHIDSIATNGVRFTQGYVSGPYCSPTRAGLDDRPLPDAVRPRVQQRRPNQRGLPLTETTMADRLKDARLRDLRDRQVASRPDRRSTGRSSAASTSSTARWPTRRSFTRRSSSIRACRPTCSAWTDDSFYTTDAYAERAVDWIEQAARTSRGFCTCRSTRSTRRCRRRRSTWTGSRTSRIEKRRTFAAMMSAMDDAVGRVLDKDPRDRAGREHADLFPLRQRRPDAADDVEQRPLARLQGHRPGKAACACRSACSGKARLPAGKTLRPTRHPTRHPADVPGRGRRERSIRRGSSTA